MKRWIVERPDAKIVDELTKSLGISTVHAKILASRGLTDPAEAKDFLHMRESAMHDPFLLHEMEKAVALIKKAITSNQKIAVYGDYDADGVTSVTVLTTALERMGADVYFVIPDRFEHGYGPNKELFQRIYEQGASLIITVDNGISGVDEIAYAKSLGLQVIVTDHHEIGDELPPADAIIHPRHPEGAYPFGELAGVGVAFKLASALLGEVPKDLLELVAIGTVADLVPLLGENRYLVKEGIRQMRHVKETCNTSTRAYRWHGASSDYRGVNRIHDWSSFECCRTSRGCFAGSSSSEDGRHGPCDGISKRIGFVE